METTKTYILNEEEYLRVKKHMEWMKEQFDGDGRDEIRNAYLVGVHDVMRIIKEITNNQ